MLEGVTYALTHDDTVRAIAGKNKRGDKYKCFVVVCPEPEKFPYSVVRITGRLPEECKGSLPTTFTYNFDIYSYHNSYEDVKALNQSIMECLIRCSGTINGVTFQYVQFVTERDDYVNQYSLYCKVATYQAYVNEDQAT